jgi:undecaprenyl diphosphate synthase
VAAEEKTRANTRLTLVIAVNYGGRWDILEATRMLARKVEQGKLSATDLSLEMIEAQLAFPDLPEPDLFIRTGGEVRISNFLLWQLAYTELYFSDTLWPDFDGNCLDLAIETYAGRQRRYGRTSGQMEAVVEVPVAL